MHLRVCNVCSSVYVISATVYMWKDEAHLVQQEKKLDKEVWEIEAIFAFVLDDMQWKEAEIHLLRWAFVRHVDLNPWTDVYNMYRHKKPPRGCPSWGFSVKRNGHKKKQKHNYNVSQALVFSDLYPMTPEKPSLVVSRHIFFSQTRSNNCSFNAHFTYFTISVKWLRLIRSDDE